MSSLMYKDGFRVNNFKNIQGKLEQFIKKYYTNELIKGAILFFAIGLLYFLITLLIEHFLWLSQTGRTILFWLFVGVEATLFYKFIALPLAHLFKLKKGIGYTEASKIIGNHFPQVNDKLLNVLQLANDYRKSELLLASIDQKSSELNPVPFNIAINFKKNAKYLKYAAVPVLIILLASATGNFNLFSDSYKRVVNYQVAYEAPAPFQFFVVNDNLRAIENEPFSVEVRTQGDIVPQRAQIHINDETYFLEDMGGGAFQFTVDQPKEDLEFYLSANEVTSKPYTLEVVKVPSLVSFEMKLDYPAYTKKRDEILKSTGNATIPEGTNITWQLSTKQTETVDFVVRDTVIGFEKSAAAFTLSQRIFNNTDYQISTSNEELKNYENLGFSISVIKDAYPELDMKSERDSTDNNTMYFLGQASDDYGLSKLRVVYYPQEAEDDKSRVQIPFEATNFVQFGYTFPGNLPLTEGVDYEFFFEVVDNDALRGGKVTKSEVYNFRKLTQSELEQQQLEQQKETIDEFNKSLDKLEDQKQELKELSKTQKEKSELNFNDKKKLENFLNRQKKQEKMMQNFSKQLKENLEQFQKEETQDDEYKQLLEERLERQQKELEKNERLLEELKELSDKISKEELAKKLDELAKQQQNDKRSLEQIVELTKRYYVAKKAEKIQKELAELAKEQEELSKKEGKENTKEKQDKLNEKFEDLQKQMEELQKENQELKKPMDIESDKQTEKEINEEQQKASEKLEQSEQSQSPEQQQQQQSGAQENQKKAAQKMKKMSQQMESMMMAGGGEQMMEDAEMLRQILDNLVVYSFEQEDLMEQFRDTDNRNAAFAKRLKRQNDLRQMFEHVDDSLFSLSLRRPEIGERINKEITEVYFNVDKSLERFAENQVYQGVSNQQYALTSSNNLASFLSDVLDNMEQSMGSGSGSGSGMGSGQGGKQKGFQLPDIIQSQEQLNEQMRQGLKKSQDGQQQQGEGQESEGKDGKQGKQGQGKEGENGQKPGGEGQSGEGGSGGDSDSEQMSEQLYEIFKEQQRLRQMLEQQLDDKMGKGLNSDTKQLLKEMEQIEDELIEKGFNERTLQRMTALKHRLLKMENAAFQQGEKQERESNTNNKEFKNTTDNQIPNAAQYFNQVEILNRQVLPLRQIYKRKVQAYFKDND